MDLVLLLIGFLAALVVMAPLACWWARRSAARARRLESRMRQAERLAELGTLTGGLAHEIKNPLSTLRINLQLLEEDWRDRDGVDIDDLSRRSLNKLSTLRREADRLEATLEDFLRFAGHHELNVRRTDLNQLVQELVDFYGPQAAAGRVQLRPGLTPSPVIVRLDADLFKQAVLNLLINAQQAMANSESGGGELIVRTSIEGNRACLEVADTGPGIEPDRLEKIFQAYYSTKRGGTGLGLPTARRIIEEHGGTITVHSEPGRGTSFAVRMPLAQ